jgi:lipoprotein-releasing system permease protein
MPYTSFIARRYLKFRRGSEKKDFISFLTFIAITGITLGVAALIITLTILAGFEHEIKSKVAGFTTHIQVTGFQSQTFKNYDSAAERMRSSIDEIEAVGPFVAKEGMVSFGSDVEGVLVKGVEPANDITTAKNYIIEGTYDLHREKSQIAACAIGKKLLVKLHARCGDTIAVFGLTGSYYEMRQPKIVPFVVAAVYESGMSEYDDVYLFTDITAAQELFNVGPAATGFDVLLKDIDTAPEVAEKIQDLMGYPYYPRTLFQLYRNLFTWIELQKQPVPIILGLIILVATVNIIGTMLMVVMEKTNQIGILKSMGASNADIKKIFLFEGLFIGLTGTILGDLFAFVVCWTQQTFHYFSLNSSIYFMTQVPILFHWQNFALVSVIAFLLCMLAAYIPSAIAARLDPIRSIRFH